MKTLGDKSVRKIFGLMHDNDYTNFHLLPSNRCVVPKHVEKMVESIRMNGVNRAVVCVNTNLVDGIKKRFIIDGQHLFFALQREGYDIPYIVIDIEDTTDMIHRMALYNTSSKSWQLLDYINAYKTVNHHYMMLFNLKSLYNMEIMMIAGICMNVNSNWQSGTLSDKIKSGEFKCVNLHAEAMCKAFSDIFITIGQADRHVKFNFFYQFIQSYGTYNHSKTIKNIKKNIDVIKTITDAEYSKQYIQEKVFVF